MDIDVNWSALNFNDKLKGFVSRRLSFLVGRFRTVIMRVSIHFSDVNGPKGGVDKQCVVSVKLWTTGEITVKGKGTEYHSVFQTSFEKLIRSVRCELAKQREKPIRINRRKHFFCIQKNIPASIQAETAKTSDQRRGAFKIETGPVRLER